MPSRSFLIPGFGGLAGGVAASTPAFSWPALFFSLLSVTLRAGKAELRKCSLEQAARADMIDQSKVTLCHVGVGREWLWLDDDLNSHSCLSFLTTATCILPLWTESNRVEINRKVAGVWDHACTGLGFAGLAPAGCPPCSLLTLKTEL